MNVKEFYLAGYDVTGIQNFIFNSNKLKENIGASYIVHQILSKDLLDVITQYASNHNLSIDLVSYDYKVNEEQDFKMFMDENLAAEIIYIGGGNAYIAYKSKEIAVEITKLFSKTVYDNTYSLSVAVGFVKVCDKFK